MIGQQLFGLVLAFVPGVAMLWLQHPNPRKRATAIAVALVGALSFGAVSWGLVLQERDRRHSAARDEAERVWIRQRSDFVHAQIRDQVLWAKDKQYELANQIRTGNPTDAAMQAHLREIDLWRGAVEDFLNKNLPCTAAGLSYDYGISGGPFATLSGTVSRMLSVANGMEGLVRQSRPCLPDGLPPNQPAPDKRPSP